MSKKYKELNKKLIVLGESLPFDVLIYLTDKKSPLLFSKGEMVDQADITRMNKYPDGRLIILKDDYEKHIEDGVIKKVKKALDGGDLDKDDVSIIYEYIFENADDSDWKEYLNETIEKSSKVVSGIIDGSTVVGAKEITRILATDTSDEDLIGKHLVSLISLGGVFFLSVPGIGPDNLIEYSKLCTIHSDALAYLSGSDESSEIAEVFKSKKLKIDIARDVETIRRSIEVHINEGTFPNAEIVGAYAKHFYIMDKIFESLEIYNTAPVLKKCISQLRALQLSPDFVLNPVKGNPYIVVKVFLIIDYLVSFLKNSAESSDFDEKNIFLSAFNKIKNSSHYDGSDLSCDLVLLTKMELEISNAL